MTTPESHPTVAEEVQSIMDDIDEISCGCCYSTQYANKVRTRLTTLLTRLRAAERTLIDIANSDPADGLAMKGAAGMYLLDTLTPKQEPSNG